MKPSFFSPIVESPSLPPRLFVVVDTEEEFDWSAPFARENVSVSAIVEIPRLQKVLEPHALKPTYVVDYPVASTTVSASLLGAIAQQGRCRIGAHLHPWVTPPFEEPLVPEMSFGCNLGQPIESAKIAHLKDTIVRNIAVTPRVYKAGRYGFGETTAQILETTGFTMDASVVPHMDFTSEAGPSFMGHTSRPARFGQAARMLELPCTTFTGRQRARRGCTAPRRRTGSGPRAPSAFSRARAC
jgi:hypothetical protein